MNSRRSFFKMAASFVAGCALNVGAMASSRVVTGFKTNPEWEKADYEVCFVWTRSTKSESDRAKHFYINGSGSHPFVRTNNPNFMRDGKGAIPQYAPIYA